jgi:predicted transcriptional regulator
MKLLERVIKKPVNSTVAEPNAKLGAIAIYDTLAAPPRIINIKTNTWPDLIDELTANTYRECQQKGANFPFVVLGEVVENLVHAGFKEIVISVFNDGRTVRVSDQGPGITDKIRALEPGFTTATAEMKLLIRGVGSGLPVAKEIMGFSGGSIDVRDNLASGTVITLELSGGENRVASTYLGLSKRQVSILSLITELGSAGPSKISKELDLSISTAHRELICLEETGLLGPDGQGRRTCTTKGLGQLNKTVVGGGAGE